MLSILYIFVGAYLLFRPVAGLASLTLALAIYLFAEGVLELILSFRLRPMPGSRWLLFDGNHHADPCRHDLENVAIEH